MAFCNPNRKLPVLWLLVCLYSELATASPTTKTESRSQSLQTRAYLEDGTLNCETERSSDYYGLGVRLGVYFAWFQAWIANVCVPSEIPAAQDLNAVFLFAILVAMVRCTVSGLLLQMDGLMLMHMSGGTLFSCLTIWGYRTCIYDVEGPVKGIKNFGGYGTHFRLLLSMGVSTYGLFFWAWGIQGWLYPHPDAECDVIYTFMFSRVRADGGIRVFYIFICISCMLYFGTMVLTSLIAIPERLRHTLQARKEGDTGERVRTKFATGLNQKQLRLIFYFLRIGNFIFIVYSMILIEFTLNYNHVATVLGWRGHIFFPSQIIPMIIGAVGFCKVVWVRYREWKAPDYLHSQTRRTILKPDIQALKRIYTPKSNISFESANALSDNLMDPLMQSQPVWLQMLVSWLPWLALLRWWKPKQSNNNGSTYGQGGAGNDPEKSSPVSPSSTLGNSPGWSNNSTPKVTSPKQRPTWGSDDTVESARVELPQIPKNIARFGSL